MILTACLQFRLVFVLRLMIVTTLKCSPRLSGPLTVSVKVKLVNIALSLLKSLSICQGKHREEHHALSHDRVLSHSNGAKPQSRPNDEY